MSSLKYDRDKLLRAAQRVAEMSTHFDPLVAATARKLLDRIQMLPMHDVLDKVPGDTWVAKAAAIGVTRVTLHGWLTGRCRPYPQQARRLAEITGLDAAVIRGTRSR
jgi:hypothetical protein